MTEPTKTWKVGELARLTGLTVRTLHHYDQIGLLPASARTRSGYRLYSEQDVRRLHGVLTLRELKVPLESIAELLDGEPAIVELLQDHLAQVDHQLTTLRGLRTHLSALIEAAQEKKAPTVEELFDLVSEMNAAKQKFDSYFSSAQLAALADRRDVLGDQAVRETVAQWPQLIAEVQTEMDHQTDPTEPRVQDLAWQWTRLLESFHGGDTGLRDSLYRLRADNSAEISQRGGPSQEMISYIAEAIESLPETHG